MRNSLLSWKSSAVQLELSKIESLRTANLACDQQAVECCNAMLSSSVIDGVATVAR